MSNYGVSSEKLKDFRNTCLDRKFKIISDKGIEFSVSGFNIIWKEPDVDNLTHCKSNVIGKAVFTIAKTKVVLQVFHQIDVKHKHNLLLIWPCKYLCKGEEHLFVEIYRNLTTKTKHSQILWHERILTTIGLHLQ